MPLHKDLADAHLHEPKGIAGASANRVYVSNGSGSGAWSQVTTSLMSQTANAFGANLFHVQKRISPGGTYQSASASTWNVRQLDTSVTNEITSASLSSNRITLPAGTYWLEADALAWSSCGVNWLRVYNITGSAALLVGLHQNVFSSSTVPAATVRGRFTLSVSSALELQHFTVSASAGGTFTDIGAGVSVVADVAVWRIA